MEKTKSILVAGLFVWAGLAGTARGKDDRSLPHRILVKVWDRASVPKAQWDPARRVVEEAFRTAGLEVGWLTCGPDAPPACSCPTAPGEIGLRIFRPLPAERQRAGHFTGGAALIIPENGRGIVYVFFDRVEEVAKEGRIPLHLVLGTTAAHEIGHVLLPPGHSATGIMQAHLSRRDWKDATQGGLSFGPHDAARMRHRLAAREAAREPEHAAALGPHPGEWTMHIY